MKKILSQYIRLSMVWFVVGLIVCGSAYANDEQMNSYLRQIVVQLQQIKPLVRQAELAQEQHPRTLFHFNDWVDANGVHHQGLRKDINTIQQALMNAINKESMEPRHFKPLKADFIEVQ